MGRSSSIYAYGSQIIFKINALFHIFSYPQLTVYDIHGEKGGPPTVLSLCDVMAIGDDNSPGLSFTDAMAVIKGHVPKGYKVQHTLCAELCTLEPIFYCF